MTAWLAYQERFGSICLAPAPATAELAALGGDASRWLAYRRMVRARLRETLAWGLGELAALVGDGVFDLWIERFLAEAPPRSPYLRDVPAEMLAWVERRWASLSTAPGVPAYALDAARWGWSRREVEAVEERRDRDAVGELSMERPAALSATTRLLRLEHAVHRDPPGARAPTRLCVYREPATHEVKTLELTPFAFALLDALVRPHASLLAAIREVASRDGVALDEPLVSALSALFADLMERGVLLGAAPGR